MNSLFDVQLQKVRGQELNVDPDWVNGLRKTVYSAEGDDLSKQLETAKDNPLSSLRTYLR